MIQGDEFFMRLLHWERLALVHGESTKLLSENLIVKNELYLVFKLKEQHKGRAIHHQKLKQGLA